MATRKILTIANFKNKPLNPSETFLTSNFLITEGNRIIMSVAVSGSLTIEYTRNGTDYITVNSNEMQAANGSYIYRLAIAAGDLFNVRTKEATITTLTSFTAELYLEA